MKKKSLAMIFVLKSNMWIFKSMALYNCDEKGNREENAETRGFFNIYFWFFIFNHLYKLKVEIQLMSKCQVLCLSATLDLPGACLLRVYVAYAH